MVKIAVIGIGNLLMQDEGVGVHLVNALSQKYYFEPQILLIDGGTTGTDLLSYFAENSHILLLDAVNFHKEPGFIGSYENDEILTRLNTKLSLHHLGLTDVLSTNKLLGVRPEQTFLLGIQPERMEVGMELTETIISRLPRMEEIALKKLSEWGVQASEKSIFTAGQ